MMGSRRKKTNCSECSEPVASYKCPTCYSKYCSSTCCKSHKEKCALLSPPKSETGGNNRSMGLKRRHDYAFLTEDTVALSKLLEIKGDERVQALLKDPKVRGLMTKLDGAPNPQKAFSIIMKNPEFRAFSNVILQIVGVTEDYDLDEG